MLAQTPPGMLAGQRRPPFGPRPSESFRERAASSRPLGIPLGIGRFRKAAEKGGLLCGRHKERVFSGGGRRLTLMSSSSEHFCGSCCVPQERVPTL